jgi:hypothetical protein
VSTIVVSGLGRCGSSLTMQMLEAGGVPCVGGFPAYEPPETNHGCVTTEWLRSNDGKAVKILDPHSPSAPYAVNPFLPSVNLKIIWLDRDPQEQAKSVLKFAQMLLGMSPNYSSWELMAKRMKAERGQALAMYGSSHPLKVVTFESILVNPKAVAESIAEFLPDYTLDIPAMVKAVHPRYASCAPGLDMEIRLIESIKG